MRYGSVCSGIEAATAAWHHMGWEPAFLSEIEKFPRAVLAHHYPDVPLHGDFTTIGANQYGTIDLLVGGTPCQSFSVAGLRGGLDDDRGNLALEFCRLAQREQPRWIVWENVPGVLSSSGGRDFGSILGALEDLGYGLAYRVLDAQYFGVAQRRRRVFVVGYLGDWRPAAAVLFERHSMSGHPAPSREARKDLAPTISARTKGGGGLGTDFDCDGGLVAGGRERSGVDVAPTMQAGGNSTGGTRPYGTTVDTCEALIASTFNDDGTARTLTARYDSSPCVDRGPDVVGTLSCNTGPRGHDAGNFACNQAVDAGHLIASDGPDVVGTLRTKRPGEGGVQGDFDHIVPVFNRALNTQSGSHHAPDTKAYVAFAQNTRDEVRLVNGDGAIVGALAAHPGTKQTSYVAFTSNMSEPDCQTDGTTPTLKLGGHGGGNPPAVAFAIQDVRGLDKKQNGKGWSDEGASYTVDTHATQGVAFAIQERAVCENPDAGPDGIGVRADDAAYTLEARSTPQAVVYGFQPRIARNGRGDMGDVVAALNAQSSETGKGDAAPCVALAHTATHEVAGTLKACAGGGGWSNSIDHAAAGYMALVPAVAFSAKDYGADATEELSPTLRAGGFMNSHQNGGVMPAVFISSAVRRLTPVECERLQGFPDGFTDIPWGKKPVGECPDGPRYKALGNSMAVPVMRWIGERIQLVDDFVSLF